MERKEFLSTLAGVAATAAVTPGAFGQKKLTPQESSLVKVTQKHNIKRGVALYSYQKALKSHYMTLEDCIRELSDIGAYGVEAIGQVVVKDYPYPTDKWIGEWWNMMDKYGTIPDCYTDFHDTHRRLKAMTVDENLEYLTRDLKLARKMGFKTIRLLIGTPIELIQKAVPVAADLGLWMGGELHSPIPLKGPLVARWLEIAAKYPDTFGLIPDMGIFTKYPSPSTREKQIANGTLTRETALYIENSFRVGLNKADVEKKIAGMKPTPGDTNYVQTVYGAKWEDPKDLLPIVKYSKHIHGKFHEMNRGKDYTDARIIYDEVIPVLIDGGFNGYIASEFEGQRMIDNVDEVNEVRRQHVMLKRLLGE
jgi:hypothetical protein